MKKLIYLLLLISGSAFAQIPAANDTTLYSGTTAFTPQFRFKNVTLNGVSYRIPQVYNSLLGKYDTYITSKYLRAFYAPLIGGGNYIQNQNTIYQTAKFKIAGTGSVNDTLSVTHKDSIVSAPFNLINYGGFTGSKNFVPVSMYRLAGSGAFAANTKYNSESDLYNDITHAADTTRAIAMVEVGGEGVTIKGMPISGSTATVSETDQRNILQARVDGTRNSGGVGDIGKVWLQNFTGVYAENIASQPNIWSSGASNTTPFGYYRKQGANTTEAWRYMSSGATAQGQYQVWQKSRGTLVSPTANNSGDAVYDIRVQTYGGAGYYDGAYLKAVTSAATTDSSAPMDWVLATAPTGSLTATEKLRIGADGQTTAQGGFYAVGDGVNDMFNATRSGITRMTVKNATNAVGINTTTPAASLDISDGRYTTSNPALMIGADLDAITRTNSVAKIGVISTPHYNTSEEPIMNMYSYSDATNNEISYGGGLSSYNAPTSLVFYTAANNTTVTGTERLRINSTNITATLPVIMPTGSTAVTQSAGDNSDKVATTAYVDAAVSSGTYSANCTNITNLTGGTSFIGKYIRVGNIVTVYTRYSTTTTGTGASVFEVDLPVASNFTSVEQGYGHGSASTDTAKNIVISTNPTTDRVAVSFTATAATSVSIYFSFSYEVL